MQRKSHTREKCSLQDGEYRPVHAVRPAHLSLLGLLAWILALYALLAAEPSLSSEIHRQKVSVLALSSTQVQLGSRTLSYGAQGDEVLELQYRLNLLGFYIKVLDGVYGGETQRAVIQFQRAAKLPATGVVDNQTARLIMDGKIKNKGQYAKSQQPAKRPQHGASSSVSKATPAKQQANPSPQSPQSNKASIAEETYIVRPGDCLYILSQESGATVEEIMKRNSLPGTTIYVGQKLVIPQKRAQPAQESYIVKAGDCLTLIASKFNTTAANIAKANRLKNPDLIWAGQKLTIPLG